MCRAPLGPTVAGLAGCLLAATLGAAGAADGTQVLDATDDTFKAPGRVGLWTKADSVIQFDDFTVQGH